MTASPIIQTEMKFVTTLHLVFHICCQQFKRHFETHGTIIIFKNIITQNWKRNSSKFFESHNNPSKRRIWLAGRRLDTTDIFIPFSSRLLSKNFKIKIYKTIILPVVLYGCETWSLTLREERRLRIFGTGSWGRFFWAQEGCEWGVEKASQWGTS